MKRSTPLARLVAVGALAASTLAGATLYPGHLATVPSVAAHSVLERSDPADGARLATPPGRLTLTFNEDINPNFATLTLVDGERRNLLSGSPAVSGHAVSAPVPEIPSGAYTVGYRVTSADGHVIQGSTRFTVGGDQTGDRTTASATGASDAAPSSDSGVGSTPALLALGGVAVLLAGGALWVVRRGRS